MWKRYLPTTVVLATTAALILACGGASFELDVEGDEQSAPTAARVDLGPLFSGIEKGCEGNPDLSALYQSLAVEAPGGRSEAASSVSVPRAFRAALGSPVIRDASDDATTLELPVTGGIYQGFKVTRLTMTNGHNNGIYVYGLVLAGPPEEVEGRLRSALDIVDSCAADPVCPTEPVVMAFGPHPDGTAVLCDASM